MEIDRDHGIALTGNDARVPPRGPAIVERSLRPAMDIEDCGHGSAPVRELGDLAPDRVAIRTLEAESFDLHRGERAHALGGDLGQRLGLTIPLRKEQFGRRSDRIAREQQPVIDQRRDIADMRFIARHQVELVDRAGLRIDAEGGRVEHVLRGGDQIPAVGRPGERAEAAIEILRQRRDHARRHIAQHHHHPVRLVGRARHGGIGEILAVGRRRRQRVVGFVRSGEIDGCLAGKVREPDVEIGR